MATNPYMSGMATAPTNPYLSNVVGSMQQQATQNLQRNLLPSIRSGAMAAGGFGGSRQGIAEGIALGDTQQGLTNATANLYSNAYGQDQNFYLQNRGLDNQMSIANRGFDLQDKGLNNQFALGNRGLDLQNKGLDQNFQLGQGGLDLQRLGIQNQFALGNRGLDLQGQSIGNQFALGNRGLDLQGRGMDQSFYTAQRGQDINQQGQQFNQYLQAIGALTGMGQGMTQIGQQQQQAGLWPLQQFAGLVNPLTGLGGTNSTQQPGYGGGFAGALGGGLTAAQLIKLLGG